MYLLIADSSLNNLKQVCGCRILSGILLKKMRLSIVQFFKKTVPGHIFRGKRRFVKRVSKKAMDTLVKEYELQDRNMLLLRHPYLTLEESSGHAKALNKNNERIQKWLDTRTLSKMKPDITLEDRLMHLKVKESWE